MTSSFSPVKPWAQFGEKMIRGVKYDSYSMTHISILVGCGATSFRNYQLRPFRFDRKR